MKIQNDQEIDRELKYSPFFVLSTKLGSSSPLFPHENLMIFKSQLAVSSNQENQCSVIEKSHCLAFKDEWIAW